MLALAAMGGTANAEGYPTKAAKMIVGFTPGGTIDVVARIVGDKLGSKLGKPFVVEFENRSGANGMLAATAVAQSEPDGYTIFVSNSSSITFNPTFFKDIKYLSKTRLRAKSTTVVSVPLITPSMPAIPRRPISRALADLIAKAKANPGDGELWLRQATATLPIWRGSAQPAGRHPDAAHSLIAERRRRRSGCSATR